MKIKNPLNKQESYWILLLKVLSHWTDGFGFAELSRCDSVLVVTWVVKRFSKWIQNCFSVLASCQISPLSDQPSCDFEPSHVQHWSSALREKYFNDTRVNSSLGKADYAISVILEVMLILFVVYFYLKQMHQMNFQSVIWNRGF